MSGWGAQPWGGAPWGGGGVAASTPPDWTPEPALPAERLPQWAVHVRDVDLALVGQVATWTELRVVERHNDVGSWLVTFSADDPVVADVLASRAGIVITRDAQMVTSGPVRVHRVVRDRAGTWVTIAGPDDMAVLADRVAKAEPATAAPVYVGDRWDLRTGQASTILREFIDANCGPAATADRRSDITLAADPTVGQSMTERARYPSLLDVARRIARRSSPHIAFRARQGTWDGERWTLAEQVTVAIFAARDRTDEIIWTDQLGGIDGYEYSWAAPETTWAIVGGDIDTGHRLIAEAGDPAAIAQWGRIERFYDERNIDNYAELAARSAEEVAAIASDFAFEANVEDGPGPYGWLTDWRCGDLITVEIAGQRHTERIREVDISVDASGEHVAPKVGSERAVFGGAQSKTHAMLRRLAERAGQLEQSY